VEYLILYGYSCLLEERDREEKEGKKSSARAEDCSSTVEGNKKGVDACSSFTFTFATGFVRRGARGKKREGKKTRRSGIRHSSQHLGLREKRLRNREGRRMSPIFQLSIEWFAEGSQGGGVGNKSMGLTTDCRFSVLTCVCVWWEEKGGWKKKKGNSGKICFQTLSPQCVRRTEGGKTGRRVKRGKNGSAAVSFLVGEHPQRGPGKEEKELKKDREGGERKKANV